MCTMLSITIAPSPRDLQEMFRPYSFLPTKSVRGIPFEFCGDRLYVFNKIFSLAVNESNAGQVEHGNKLNCGTVLES